MKTIFVAGAALAALMAVPSLAQPDEGRARSAEPLTRAAVQARVQARFARADANRDGFVTQDEVRARAEARRGQRQERSGERREARFDRLDSNHDGSISRAEFDARPAFGGGERQGMRGQRRGQSFAHRGGRGGGPMGGLGGRAFAAMDLDHDGRVALAEANRAAFERFDRLDSDRDGTISQSERQAAREAFRERMQDRPGD
jgi:Ca2+-binding EF-hand superfamily protein